VYKFEKIVEGELKLTSGNQMQDGRTDIQTDMDKT